MSETTQHPLVRRLLFALVAIGALMALGTLARGIWLFDGGGDWLVGAGFILLGMLPPLVGVFIGWRMLKRPGDEALSRLLPKLGSLVSYTASVLVIYATTLFERAVWEDAQAGLVFLFMPLVGLGLGGIGALTGAIVGWTIAKAVGR